MVVSSRQVASAAPPVVVRVVTPRITEHRPPTSSTGVTPPRMRVSMSFSPKEELRAPTPRSTAPPRGTAGSLSAQMAPATAAATWPPGPSAGAGAASTTRSLLRPAARVTSWAAVSPEALPTTAMRSRRIWEASSTLARRACWTARSVLSHTTTSTSSCSASRAKAAA